MLLAALALLDGDEPLVLREKVAVEGRYVRLADVVEGGEARPELANIYLGRAPGGDRVRTLTAGEIRRALRWHKLEIEIAGEMVEVAGGEGNAEPARKRTAVWRGDVVRAAGDGYEVDARALADGAVGEEVALEIVATGSRRSGRVVSATQVDVTEGEGR